MLIEKHFDLAPILNNHVFVKANDEYKIDHIVE